MNYTHGTVPIMPDPHKLEKELLRQHLTEFGGAVIFWIENVSREAQCQLSGCEKSIRCREHRVAVVPGHLGRRTTLRLKKRSTFYHIACFERLVDLSDPEYSSRMRAVNKMVCGKDDRDIDATNTSGGLYVLSAGAELIILEWKARQSFRTESDRGYAQADGYFLSRQSEEDEQRLAYLRSLDQVAVPSLGETWGYIDSYFKAFDDTKNTLADLLAVWEVDMKLAVAKPERLTEEEHRLKEDLGANVLKVIASLCRTDR